ncbi:diguanylate cyclase (GGDEF)-like protein [Pseudacidovorax intermedius]|uniref:Diguanylate cyclase (GGDEF)-like protein n=1 Tax=Pseudacidovorax intermedius TaxID=433924 RepID=A0A370FA09_9BURK|nr:bifunctional diguanylate cyclase/phosphodiesterase [Pseudacidovorax intermedius]RDI19048.1 diguanylate cyclase (GGDEF)-like protein [Pseudacidovorax intermedius]
MPHRLPRPAVCHFRTVAGELRWADAAAEALTCGAAEAGIKAKTLLAAGERGFEEAEVPAKGPGPACWVGLRSPKGRVQVELRGERAEDGSVLWTASRGPGTEVLHRLDPLTRLPGRLPSLPELSAERSVPLARLAVIYLDLDRFREINGRFGPSGGDAVLLEVVHRLELGLPEDAALARVGGDEFAAVLPNAGWPECQGILEYCLGRLGDDFQVHGQPLTVGASVGVALREQEGPSIEVLLRQARQAAFGAKRAGGGQVNFFDAQEHAHEQRLAQQRQRIAEGLDAGEFFLVFQPKVDMQRGTIVGMEALSRWNHAQRGVLMPAEFVPTIEDHELSEQLGEWAIGAAIEAVRQWAAQGRRLSVSVNISAGLLMRADVVRRLSALLERFPERHAGALVLEILETSAIRDIDLAASFIESCRQLGVSVVMDDFGTGYSSLTYLRRLPVSGLKLDQSFVRNVLTDAQDRAILQGVISLAQALGLEVTAEGVETREHGEALLALGCHLAQGFGIARPMPAAEVFGWIDAYEKQPLWKPASDNAPAMNKALQP